MSSKLLLTDITSSLGRAILAALESSHHSVVFLSPQELEWDDEVAVRAYVDLVKPDVIINTVGWHESLSAPQSQYFITAARHLASYCQRADIPVIHFSSFHVFGGENKSAYDELDKASPLNEIGRLFESSERAFEVVAHRICLRLGWLLDTDSDSRFNKLLDRAVNSETDISVYYQRRGNPVSLDKVALLVVAMLNQLLCGAENWGVFHFGSSDSCTMAEFTESIEEILRREDSLKASFRLRELAEQELEQLDEPVNCVLAMRRCRDDFGVQDVSWRAGLSSLVGHWLATKRAAQ